MTAVPIPSHRAIDPSFSSILIKHILNNSHSYEHQENNTSGHKGCRQTQPS